MTSLPIAFAAFLPPSFSNIALALATGGWPDMCAWCAPVMAVHDREYVDAARALDAGGLGTFFAISFPSNCGLYSCRYLYAWPE